MDLNSSAITSAENSECSIHRKVFVEEIIQNISSSTTFIRKINCEEVYDFQQRNARARVVENIIKIQSSCGEIFNAVTTKTNFQRPALTGNISNCDNKPNLASITEVCEETPMEVDSSTDLILSAPNDYKKKFRRRKKTYNKTEQKGFEDYSNNEMCVLIPLKQPLVSKFSGVLLILTVLLILLGIYIIVTGDYFIFVNDKIQFENVKRELEENVLNQENAIKAVVHSLERVHSRTGLTILPFIGTTGIGKTFTVNIIKKHFLPSLVHEIDSNFLVNMEKQKITIPNLNSCCCNLIIIDNLKVSYFDNLAHFLKMLPRSMSVLVIPIFNIHDTMDGVTYTINEEDFQSVRDNFERLGLYYELVLFDVLNVKVIEKWLRNELHNRQVHPDRHDKLVKSLLNEDQVKYTGFKGLNTKLLSSINVHE